MTGIPAGGLPAVCRGPSAYGALPVRLEVRGWVWGRRRRVESEGTPEPVSDYHDTCAATGSFTYKEEETNGNGLVISTGLKVPSYKDVEILPKIDYTQIHTQTTGITDTVNQDQPYTIYWLDKVPVTQTLRGNWHYEGDSVKAMPARDFPDVEADVTYTAFRKQSRPMTEEEKISRCGNASPS